MLNSYSFLRIKASLILRKPLQFSVAEVFDHIDELEGRRVLLVGRASSVEGLGSIGIYDLADKTGILCLTTLHTAPSEGSVLAVEVEIRKILTVSGNIFIIGVETDKRRIRNAHITGIQ